MFFGSYLVYICTFLVTVALATLYNNKKKRIKVIFKKHIFDSRDIYLFLMIIVLSVVCGGRGFDVGIDTQSYVQWQFEYIRKFGINAGTMPYVIRLLVYLIERAFNDYHVVYLIVSLITNTLIILRFRDFKEKTSFPLLVYGYVCYVYCAEFNTWRQLLAVAVVFYVSRYAFDRKYIKCFIFNIIAILIHSSAILGLLVIPIDLFLYSKEDRIRKKLSNYILVLTPIILLLAIIIIYRYFDWQRYVYHYYHYGTTLEIGFMIPARLFMLLALDRLCIDRLKTTYNVFQKKLFVFSFMGILIMSLDYFVVYAGRLAYYYILFEPILYGLKPPYWKNIKVMKGLQFAYCLLGLYSFATQLILNGNKIIPYTFWD